MNHKDRLLYVVCCSEHTKDSVKRIMGQSAKLEQRLVHRKTKSSKIWTYDHNAVVESLC